MVVQYSKPATGRYVTSSVSQFVGRQHEMASLLNQYEAAKSGWTKVVLLAGEVGIGKTRLLDEFASRVAEDGAAVLQGSASDSEGMPPYLPFLEALGRYIRATPLHTLSEQIVVAPQILASILPELATRMGDFPTAYPLLPEQTRLRLYEAIGMLLEAISVPHMLVLTLDDLHWADTSSLDLLCYIAHHHTKAKLLIVGTYREGELDGNTALERTVTELARQRILAKIEVGPLSATESEALAVSYLDGSISPTLSRLLHTQSEGNPFFVEELIQGWLETGTLVQRNTQWDWQANTSLEHTIPQSIIGALRQRFAQLSSDVIDHLRIAAIIGRSFDISLLAMVEGQEVEAIEERLLEAEHIRLIRADQPGVFRFSHETIRKCLYSEVSTSRRQRLHGSIGLVLEGRYEKDSRKSAYQLTELAFHFTHSRDRIRGATYSQLAAEQTLQSSAPREAMVHYKTALELLDPKDTRIGTLLSGLGEAAFLSGANDEAMKAYETAFTWLLQSDNHKTAAQAAHKLGLVHWRQHDLQAARTALEQALALLENTLSAEIVRVLVDISMLLTIYMNQHAEGMAYARQALEIAHSLDDKRLEVTANRGVAVNLCLSSNNVSAALRSLEQTFAIAETSGDVCEAAECSFYLAVIYYLRAEIKHSNDVSLRGLQYIQHCQNQYQMCYVSSWQALLHALQGGWSQAEQAIEQAQTFLHNQSGSIPLAFLHHVRGVIAYQQEDYIAAQQEFQAATENQQPGSHGLMYFTKLADLAQVASGNKENAYNHLTELEALLNNLPVGSLLTLPIITCMALIAIALDDHSLVAKLYPRLLPFRGHLYGFLVDRVLGELAILRQDWEMVLTHLSEAETIAQREGLRPELARILISKANFEITRGGQGSDTRSRNYLHRALVLFEKLTMVQSVDRVRHQLRTLPQHVDSPSRHSFPANLSIREVSVLRLVVQGMSNRQIAQELAISEKTVANHLSHIFNKTASENRAAATAFAIRHGLA